MRLILTITLFLAMLGPGSPRAEVVEVPLDDLIGFYPPDPTGTRTATFTVDPAPLVVNTVWFRFSGTTTVGTVECDGGSTDAYPMEFFAAMADPTTGGDWNAFEPMPTVTGPFTFTIEFMPRFGPTPSWTFLLDGEAEISLFGAPVALVGLCWPITPDPDATVDEAVLIIDGEFPIAVETETWSKVKSLYSSP